MYDSNNHKIEWQLIVNLYNFQRTNGFTYANKLSKQHIMFEKNKMKVKYAVQVLSQSVASALLTLCDLQHPDFVNVHPTVNYLKQFDQIFDVRNSRSLTHHLRKGPIQESNVDEWKSVFESTVLYISGLKTPAGKPVLESTRYAAFLGWLVNIKTITELYQYVVTSGEMSFICTFKLSQDPLENFFSSIRMSSGLNNNPTSTQFKTAFQTLLCNTFNKKATVLFP